MKKGNARIVDMERAKALRIISWCKRHLASAEGQVEDGFTEAARKALLEGMDHKNYHVRRAAWRGRGCPLPGELSRASIEELARKLHPNLVETVLKAYEVAKNKEIELKVLVGEAKDAALTRWKKAGLEFLISLLVHLGADPAAEIFDFAEEEGLKSGKELAYYTTLV